ncbi:MAG: inorganic phosphate transporter [Sulfurimonas sp.]|nr:inorganic phosphate transporter [Sulfurimonas sp.]
MDPLTLAIIVGAGAVGFYMAWSIGANDVANSMATSVGSKAITFRQAVIIAGILSIVGAVFVGKHVTETVKSGIIKIGDTAIDPNVLILGFFASLLAAAIWVTLSTWKEMPISTTHSIIGALVGFGLIQLGANSIEWGKLGFVASSWILSPIVGCIIAFFVFKVIVKLIFAKEEPVHSAKVVSPFIIGATAFLITAALLLGTQLSEKLGIDENYPIIFSIATVGLILVSLLSLFLLRKIQAKGLEDYATVEGIFGKLQVITACYMAFSHGANDVANAIGPLAAISDAVVSGGISSKASIPLWVMGVGAIGIALGLALYGPKLIKTVGSEITELDQIRAFSIAMAASITVIIASQLGLPVSSTHIAIGGVFGVGFLREWLHIRDDKNTIEEDRVIIQDERENKNAYNAELKTLESKNEKVQEDYSRIVELYKLIANEKKIIKSTKKDIKRAKKVQYVKRDAIKKIVAAWVITVPAAAILAGILFFTIKGIMV